MPFLSGIGFFGNSYRRFRGSVFGMSGHVQPSVEHRTGVDAQYRRVDIAANASAGKYFHAVLGFNSPEELSMNFNISNLHVGMDHSVFTDD